MLVPAGMGLISLPVAGVAGDWGVAAGLAILALLSAGLASVALLIEKHPEVTVRGALVAAAVAWLLVAVLCSLPFFVAARFAAAQGAGQLAIFVSPWNAFFESMSGITTTGLTVVDHPSQLPVSLVWWRSLCQWVGGAGVVLLVLAVVDPHGEGRTLFRIEGHTASLRDDIRLAARGLWKVYVALTAGGILLLWILGMSPWYALNFAMTAIATGGFAPNDQSLVGMPVPLQAAITLLVILGATSFLTYAYVVRGQWRRVTGDVQLRVFLALLVVGTVLIFALRHHQVGQSSAIAAWVQTVSTLGTAGYYSEDLAAWSEAAWFTLTIAMIVGGATGSASGGIKIERAWTLLVTIGAYLRRVVTEPHLFVYRPGVLSHEVRPGFGGHIAVAVIMLMFWLTTIAIGSLCLVFLLPPATSLVAIVFDATSAVSTVGLSTGLVSATMPDTAKALFIALMWMGRLEIVPVIVLLATLAGPRRRKRKGTGP
jgi:trk system potassium uptake protein TrkH